MALYALQGAGTPQFICPPASTITGTTTAWYAANAVTFNRFSLVSAASFRYVTLYVGSASGNVQVGVVAVTHGAGDAYTGLRVMTSGIIACPTAGHNRVDCGNTALTAGDYAVFLWCDNTTATFSHGTSTPLQSARISFSRTGFTSGVDATPNTLNPSTRWVASLGLEPDGTA